MTLSNSEPNNEPPGKPPAVSHGSAQPTNVDDSTLSLFEKVQSVKEEATKILEATTWPGKSAAVAQEFSNTIKNTPNLRNISNRAVLSSPDLQNDVQLVIQLLEGVQGRLASASSNYGAGKKGMLGFFKKNISWGANRSSRILRSCRVDVEKAWTPLHHRLENDLGANNDVEPNSQIPQDIHPSSSEATPGVKPQDNAIGAEGTPPKETGTPRNSIPNPTPMDMSTSSTTNHDDVEPSSQIPPIIHPPLSEATPGVEPQDNLAGAEGTPAKQTDTTRNSTANPAPRGASTSSPTVDTVSGFIPIVGSYVGAAAKVGSAVVEMVQTMDENEEIAKNLENRASKLSDLIGYFKEQSARTGGENIKARINELESEITDIQKQVDEWKSTGKLEKAWSATDHSDALKAYETTVGNSLAEMQILATFNITDLLGKINTHSLLDRLGKGYYGIQRTSSDNATCLVGTRVDVLNRIDDWVNDWEKAESAKSVLWIRGMPGRGKSTITRSVADRWKNRAACATFHVRRGQDGTNQQVICAIARQLAQSPLPEVASAILGSVQENHDIAGQQFKDQFDKLLIEPLKSPKYPPRPIVLIIDALDEFQEAKDAVEIINLIHDRASELPANIKFLLTSRPEAKLLSAFHRFLKDWQQVDLDSIADTDLYPDIKLFVENEFSAIKQKREEEDYLAGDWPSLGDISKVVKMSQGLFQWARTAMAYIDAGAPDLRLSELLELPSIGGLDDLYFNILSKAFDSKNGHPGRQELISWVLGTLVATPRPVTLEIVAFLYADHATFKTQEQKRIVYLLRKDILADLNSLIHIPENSSDPIRLLHTSIRDYLTDKGRSLGLGYEFDVIQSHRRLLDVCLRLMGRDLRRNICDFSDLSTPTSDNDEIRRMVDLRVSQGLRHCCCVWSVHLTAGRPWKEANAPTSMNIPSGLQTFSEKNILNWLEIMSLTGATDEAWVIANGVWQWLLECPGEVSDSSLITLWDDTQRFIVVFHEPISYGVPHIYASALAHCPMRTKLWEHYGSLTTVHVPKALQMQEWPPGVWKKSADSLVYSVAFSPDGKTLASGSYDGTIRLWNAQTGSPLGEPLKGHSYAVNSVAFSPDGKTLASGSDDDTIRLWNPQTGSPLGEPLKGHSNSVNSVAFSPDGKTLASGSGDGTIRLWNAQTGSPLGEPLKGHSDSVRSVAFSPDGKTLASGSHDETIRLWNAQTGSPLGEPLEGHSWWVRSVAFSPDGKTLASGSYHGTIRLWNAQTGSPLGEPLKGHSYLVNSVAFSPDGKTLASGSDDQTIRMWNAHTGSPLGGPLEGHSHRVWSVAFSPDGKTLASGSDEKTIRLWNAQTGSSLSEPLKGHSHSVTYVAFSPDGKTLASGSHGGTIRLCNAQTGSPLGEPLKGHSFTVSSVAFSLDGKTLASGSSDETIRLWNAQTGSPLGEPLKGHSHWVTSIAFSPDGKTLASGSHDHTIRLWNAETGSPLGEPLKGHSHSVTSVAFSPDGKTLASGSADQTIRLWNAQTGSPLGEPLKGHSGSVTYVAFLLDGKTLASRYYDGATRLWNAQTGLPLDGHSNWIGSVTASPNGKLGARIHQQTNMQLTSWPQINLEHREQWLTLHNDRLLWLPERYWRGDPIIAKLSKGTVAFVSNGFVSCFDVSGALGLPAD